MDNGNKPASPISLESTDRIDNGIDIYTGLTKREHFAAMAMQGLLVGTKYAVLGPATAKDAVFFADSLLKALEES